MRPFCCHLSIVHLDVSSQESDIMFSAQHLSRLHERLYVPGKSSAHSQFRHLRTRLTIDHHRSTPTRPTQPAPWPPTPSRAASLQVSPRLPATSSPPPPSLMLLSHLNIGLSADPSLLPSYSRIPTLRHANVPRPWDTVGVIARGVPHARHGPVPVPLLQVRQAAAAAEQVCAGLKRAAPPSPPSLREVVVRGRTSQKKDGNVPCQAVYCLDCILFFGAEK